MRTIIIDAETVPQSHELLEARMPEELRKPIMPEEIRDPQEPDFSEGCPAYASIRDKDEQTAKRHKWIAAKANKWHAAAQEARQKWELGIVEARTKFTQNAALDAKLGHAKLIGMKDAETGEVRIYVWEPDPKQMARIRAWGKSPDYPQHVLILPSMTEAEMLTDFFAYFREVMKEADTPFIRGQEKPPQCVTYCGNSFDFPFLYRRSWLTGAPQVPLYRRGRYWDESRMVDLRDLWTFGSREDKDRSGGLDNLAAALGYERPKLHGGADFHRFYAEDPAEGIMYNLADIDQTLYVARRLGVVR